MTDMYGAESHNPETDKEEGIAPGSDPVHEPPSEYEFSDGQEGVITEEDEGEGLPGAPGNRSPLLPILAAVGGVLLLGGVAWWQFGGAAAPDLGAEVVAEAPATTAPQEVASTETAPKTEAASLLEQVAGGAVPLPAAETTPPTPAEPAASSAPALATSLPPVPAAPSAPAALPTAPDALAPVPAVPAPAPAAIPTPAPAAAPAPAVVAPLPVTSAVPAPAASGGVDPRVETLTVRVESLQKALDQANTQLAASKEMQLRLNKLEQQLASGAQASSAPSAAAAPSLSEPESLAAPVVRKEPVKRKAVVAATPKAPAAPKAVRQWTLRAASPGLAWIAPSASSQDLRQVEVGDTLPGVGRVTAIEMQGDAWTVRGTKGIIR